MTTIEEQIQTAASYLKNTLPYLPDIKLILGSGFDVIMDLVEVDKEISYRDIPGYPQSTVEGHKGSLVTGRYNGVRLLIMRGRFHYYEGHDMQTLSIPIRVAKLLGVETLLLTNSAGAVNTSFSAGNCMFITDHLNLTFTNPLIGPNLDHFGTRFPDSSKTYTPVLLQKARVAAEEIDFQVHEGVYCFTSGPSYETPAEIRMMQTLGADAVGMSTYPEALTANHCGMQVFGMSFLSNMGSGIQDVVLDHEDVLNAFKKNADTIRLFFKNFLKSITT